MTENFLGVTMEPKKNFPSTFTVDNYSSTVTLNEPVKIAINDPEKEYNQYENRDLEHPNTFAGAFIHVVKGSLGTGILAMPMAFKSAGLALGLAGTLLVGLICTHAVHIFVAASQKMCIKNRTPSLGYGETAEAVFQNGPKSLRPWSSFARVFSDIALASTYAAGTSVYIVLMSASMQQFLEVYWPSAASDSWALYIKLIVLGLLIICCQIRELKHLVPFSFIANLTMTLAFAITLYYTFTEIPSVDVSEDREMFTTWSGLPQFFSTVIFAMEGIGTIMPVENSMVTPQFLGCPSVLNMGMLVVVTFFAAVGSCGYWAYGADTKASITQNLPTGDTLAQIVQISISIAIFFTFMLQFYVPIDIVWKKIKQYVPESRHNFGEVITRAGLVTVIVSVAIAAGDRLGPLIELVGAIFLSTLGLFIPAAVDMVLNLDNDTKWKYPIIIKDAFICTFSLFGLATGSYTAVYYGFLSHTNGTQTS